MKPVVALFFGGRSPEHDVSVVSARGIVEHLDRSRWELVLVGIDRRGAAWAGGEEMLEADVGTRGTRVRLPSDPQDRCLREAVGGEPCSPPLDVIFPVIHGWGGEDGKLQGLAAWAGIPCVGAGVLGSALAMDKDRARRLLAAEGLPVVRDAVFSGEQARDAEAIARAVEDLGWPLFVKPARSGSSVGISRVDGPEALAGAIAEAGHWDGKIVLEAAVNDPREIEIAVLGHREPEVSVAGEIEPHGAFYDYRAKYEDAESKLIIPAPLPGEVLRELRSYAVRAFVALELQGMARVDFLLERSTGKIVLNEVNTVPGFTPISMYPRLWQASGLDFSALLDRLLELATDGAEGH
ncbi:MAG TPA: D-alanine--D-alanine ligase [Acidobacteria bacterium]|nr:D-alanine--D-alanine ligase [Acidobacteriota bacterium]